MFLFMLFLNVLFGGWAFIVDSYVVQCLVQEQRETHFNTEGHTGNHSAHHLNTYASCIDDSNL